MLETQYALSKSLNHRGDPLEKVILHVAEFGTIPNEKGDDVQFTSLWLWDSENSLRSSNKNRTGMQQAEYIEKCVRTANSLGYTREELLERLRE